MNSTSRLCQYFEPARPVTIGLRFVSLSARPVRVRDIRPSHTRSLRDIRPSHTRTRYRPVPYPYAISARPIKTLCRCGSKAIRCIRLCRGNSKGSRIVRERTSLVDLRGCGGCVMRNLANYLVSGSWTRNGKANRCEARGCWSNLS